jgi:hypothetical protein
MIAISSFISLLSKTQLVVLTTCVLIPEATPFLLHGLLGSYLICWYVKALREEDTNTTLIKGSKDDGMGCDVMMPNNLKSFADPVVAPFDQTHTRHSFTILIESCCYTLIGTGTN